MASAQYPVCVLSYDVFLQAILLNLISKGGLDILPMCIKIGFEKFLAN